MSNPWSGHGHIQLCTDRHADNFINVSVQHLHRLRGQTHRSTTLHTHNTVRLPKQYCNSEDKMLNFKCTCWSTCHTIQVVSLEPEIRWIPKWSVAKHVTMSARWDQTHIFNLEKSVTWSKHRHWDPITHVTDVLPHCFALQEWRHSQAVVPVASAEEQLSIMRYNKQLSGDLNPWRERTRYEPLSPEWDHILSSIYYFNTCIYAFGWSFYLM